MSKYNELDAKILLKIRNGANTYGVLCSQLKDDAVKFSADEPWRVIDRRLQALRKKLKIIYDRGVWHTF